MNKRREQCGNLPENVNNNEHIIQNSYNNDEQNNNTCIPKNIPMLPNNFLPRFDLTVLDNLGVNIRIKWPCIKLLYIPPVLIQHLNEFIYYLLEINIIYYREKFNICYDAFMTYQSFPHMDYNIDNYVLFVLMNQLVVDFLGVKNKPDMVQSVTICYNIINRTNFTPQNLLFYYHTYLYNFEVALKSDQASMIPIMSEIRLIAFLPHFMTQSQLIQVQSHIKQYETIRSNWNDITIVENNLKNNQPPYCSSPPPSHFQSNNTPMGQLPPYCVDNSSQPDIKPSIVTQTHQNLDGTNNDAVNTNPHTNNGFSSNPNNCTPSYFNEEAFVGFNHVRKIIQQFEKKHSSQHDTVLQVLYMQMILCLNKSDISIMLTIERKIRLYTKVVDRILELIDKLKKLNSLSIFFELTKLLCWHNEINLQCQTIILKIYQGSSSDLNNENIHVDESVFDENIINNTLPIKENINTSTEYSSCCDIITPTNDTQTVQTKSSSLLDRIKIEQSNVDSPDKNPIKNIQNKLNFCNILPPNQPVQVIFQFFTNNETNNSLNENDFIILNNNHNLNFSQKKNHLSNILPYKSKMNMCDINLLFMDMLGNDGYNILKTVDILYIYSNIVLENNSSETYFSSAIHQNPLIIDILFERLYNAFENIIILSLLINNHLTDTHNRIASEYLDNFQFPMIDNVHSLNNTSNDNRLYKYFMKNIKKCINPINCNICWDQDVKKKLKLMNICGCREFSYPNIIDNSNDYLSIYHDRIAYLSIFILKIFTIFGVNNSHLLCLKPHNKETLANICVDTLQILHTTHGLNYCFSNEFLSKFDLIDDNRSFVKNQKIVNFYVMLITIINRLSDNLSQSFFESCPSLLHQLIHLIYCNNIPHCVVDVKLISYRGNNINDLSYETIKINSCFVIDVLCLGIISKITFNNHVLIQHFHKCMGINGEQCCTSTNDDSPFYLLINRLVYHKIPLFANCYINFFYYEWIFVFVHNLIYVNNQINNVSTSNIINSMQSNLGVDDQIEIYVHLTEILYDIIQTNVLYLCVNCQNKQNQNNIKYISIAAKSIHLFHFFVTVLHGLPVLDYWNILVNRLGYLIINISDTLQPIENTLQFGTYLYSLFNLICKEYNSLFQ